MLNLTLEGQNANCAYTWDLAQNFTSNTKFTKLSIKTSILCTIKPYQAEFVLLFTAPNQIKDASGNILKLLYLEQMFFLLITFQKLNKLQLLVLEVLSVHQVLSLLL